MNDILNLLLFVLMLMSIGIIHEMNWHIIKVTPEGCYERHNWTGRIRFRRSTHE